MGMNVNLDSLRSEMLEYLEAKGIVVFHSYPRTSESSFSAVYWDIDRRPDYREFLASAAAAGVRLVTLYAREFTGEVLDETLAELEIADLERDERRAMETRLRELRSYEGFTCQLELSFDHGERIYIYDLTTDWFDELNELVDQIEDATLGAEDENPLGGYYSNN